LNAPSDGSEVIAGGSAFQTFAAAVLNDYQVSKN